MAMATGTKLDAHHQQGILLDCSKAYRYLLWLECGHSGGVVQSGVVVTRKKCRACGGMKAINHVEPL